MKFSLSWLKEYLEIDDNLTVQELSEILTMIGLEVEEVIDSCEKLKGFSVAEVVECEKHPNADRLNLLKVYTGEETVQVVCGAQNCRKGLKGVFAKIGTVIPVYGEKLKKGKIRGETSYGMLCSERELCLGDDHDGIIELPTDAPVGLPINEVMEGEDVVFDIAITPNRAECLGVYGIARDLASAGVGKLKDLQIKEVKGSYESPIKVNIENKEACSLYVGRHIKNVKNCESPKWLRDKLTAIGLRPISALVDITNLINYELARPLHVFDVSKIKGDINVRNAKKGEKFISLEEKEYELDENMLGICDDQRVLALAGIMGGVDSGCVEETTDVFLEAAHFNPISVAQTGRKLQIESDSRYRFERWVDPKATISHAQYATKLILDICGGEASNLVVAGEPIDNEKEISFRPQRVKELIGVDVSKEKSKEILTKLGFEVEEKGETFNVKTPSWRNDVEGEHDLVEEVIRIYGYDKLPANKPSKEGLSEQKLSDKQRQDITLKRSLANVGMLETVTWSFTSSEYGKLFRKENDPILLANPISSDLDEMRPSLYVNLLLACAKNTKKGYPNQAMFEVGPMFYGKEVGEQKHVATGIRAGENYKKHWLGENRKVDVFDAKKDAITALGACNAPVANLQVSNQAPFYYHPGRSGCLRLGKNILGYFGEIHPKILKSFGIKETVVGFEIYPYDVPQPKKKGTKTIKMLEASQLQPLDRDFAFIVDDKINANDLIMAVRGADKNLIQNVGVFDVYEGNNLEKGKKSIALQVTLQPFEKTLKEKDLENISNKIINSVKKRTGGELRA